VWSRVEGTRLRLSKFGWDLRPHPHHPQQSPTTYSIQFLSNWWLILQNSSYMQREQLPAQGDVPGERSSHSISTLDQKVFLFGGGREEVFAQQLQFLMHLQAACQFDERYTSGTKHP